MISPPAGSRFRISPAVTPEERHGAFRLRHQVFVGELGYRIPDSDAQKGLVDPEDERAFIVVGYAGDVPAATLAVDRWQDVELPRSKITNFHLEDFAEAFGRDTVFVIRKAAVARDYRRTTLFMSVARRASEFILAHPRARFAFLESSPYLVSFYERLGYRRYAPHFLYEESGALAVPMCIVLNDHEYLARLRCPLLAQIREHGHVHDPEVQRYFHERWIVRDAAGVSAPAADAVLDPHAELSRSLEPAQIPLFENIDASQVSTFLTACRTIRFEPGAVLIAAGAPDTDLYLLTRGYVEVIRDVGDRRIAVATRGPGDLIGEMNMLLRTGRTATVVALTEVEGILISEDVLWEAAGADAVLVAQINLNIAKILAQRLRIADGLITVPPPL